MADWRMNLRNYGTIPSKSISRASDERNATPIKHTRRANHLADICLSCKAKNCKGTDKCMKKRKKELECLKKEVAQSG